jgi:nucleolar protein 14
MLGTADSSDEGDENMKRDNSKPISGDDLGDSFSFDESTRKKKGWVDEIYEREGREIGDDAAGSDDGESDDEHASDDEADEDDEEGDEDTGDEDGSSDNDFDNMSARGWEQGDDDEFDLKEDEVEDLGEKEQEIKGKVVKKGARTKGESNEKPLVKDGSLPFVIDAPSNLARTKGESNEKPLVKDGSLPFVIDAPSNLKDLSSLLDGRSEIEIIEIISRIRTCNSIRLAAENRRKMQVSDSFINFIRLMAVIVEHI